MTDLKDTTLRVEFENTDLTAKVNELGFLGALHVVSISAMGKSHSQNEDAVEVNEKKLLFCVADGISRSQGGTDAARQASQTAAKFLTSQPEVLNDESAFGQFSNANSQVQERTNNGGGASAVVLRMSGEFASLYHVGDCRAYVIRCKSLMQRSTLSVITNDHLLPAVGSSDSSGLGQALGHWIFEVGRHRVRLRLGDSIVLCSDGIYKSRNSNEFLLRLAALHGSELSDFIKKYAAYCSTNGDDDASIVHIRYRGIFGARAEAWIALCAVSLVTFLVKVGY